MTRTTQRRILLVDNQKHMRETLAVLLKMEGYHVSIATHGLDALDRLELAAPDLIVSDLTPPHLAAFEFLAFVRREFPSIPVIAVSTADDSDSHLPNDAMADVFFAKEQCRVDEFLSTIAQLIHTPVTRPSNQDALPVHARIRFMAEDSNGSHFFLLTCIKCRLSFSLDMTQIGFEGIEQTPCPFCTPSVGYVKGVSLPCAS